MTVSMINLSFSFADVCISPFNLSLRADLLPAFGTTLKRHDDCAAPNQNQFDSWDGRSFRKSVYRHDQRRHCLRSFVPIHSATGLSVT